MWGMFPSRATILSRSTASQLPTTWVCVRECMRARVINQSNTQHAHRPIDRSINQSVNRYNTPKQHHTLTPPPSPTSITTTRPSPQGGSTKNHFNRDPLTPPTPTRLSIQHAPTPQRPSPSPYSHPSINQSNTPPSLLHPPTLPPSLTSSRSLGRYFSTQGRKSALSLGAPFPLLLLLLAVATGTAAAEAAAAILGCVCASSV